MRKVFSGNLTSGFLISMVSFAVSTVILWALKTPTAYSLAISGIVFVAVLVTSILIDRKTVMTNAQHPDDVSRAPFIHIVNSTNGRISNNSVPKGVPLAKVENSDDIQFEENEQRD